MRSSSGSRTGCPRRPRTWLARCSPAGRPTGSRRWTRWTTAGCAWRCFVGDPGRGTEAIPNLGSQFPIFSRLIWQHSPFLNFFLEYSVLLYLQKLSTRVECPGIELQNIIPTKFGDRLGEENLRNLDISLYKSIWNVDVRGLQNCANLVDVKRSIAAK